MARTMTAPKKFAQTSNSQQSSITLPMFDERSRIQKLIDAQPPLNHAAVVSKPTLTHAIKMCFENPGLEDKEAASLMGIDGAQFSRILGATGHFPTNRYVEFMLTMGNDAPLIWLAHHRGYELRRIQTSLEQENERLRAELAQERHDREIERGALAQIITGRR